ncbi:hypothetical protein KGD89_16710 [Pseudomonas cichorii]|nr:hypothetical protein KGD89_16710 [Pseudomonas cichorii]
MPLPSKATWHTAKKTSLTLSNPPDEGDNLAETPHNENQHALSSATSRPHRNTADDQRPLRPGRSRPLLQMAGRKQDCLRPDQSRAGMETTEWLVYQIRLLGLSRLHHSHTDRITLWEAACWRLQRTNAEYLPVTDPFASKLPPTRFAYALTDRHYFITADFKLPETRKPLQRGFLQRFIKPGYQVI